MAVIYDSIFIVCSVKYDDYQTRSERSDQDPGLGTAGPLAWRSKPELAKSDRAPASSLAHLLV